MAGTEREIDYAIRPPGTVTLEELRGDGQVSEDIILQPQPTDDPNDPLNWQNWRKYWNYGLASFFVLMIAEFLDAATPTWGPMNVELGFSYEVLNDSYAIGCGALAIGVLLLIPFALKFGRRPLYLISTLVLFATCAWSAKLQTVADLLLINFISCLFGALAEVIVQMTIADVFFVHQRGIMNTIYVWIWNIGSTLGSLVAGYITANMGWRWLWWWNTILYGCCIIVFGLGYEETKWTPPTIGLDASAPAADHAPSQELAKRDSKEEQGEDKKTPSAFDINPVTEAGHDFEKPSERALITTSTPRVLNPSIPRETYWQRMSLTRTSPGDFLTFLRHVHQPLTMLGTIPGVGYMALVYGVTSALSTVMSTVMSSYMTEAPYDFTSDQIGLMGLAPFVGLTLGSLLCGWGSDRSILWLAKRNGGVYEPEMRLWGLLPFIPCVTAGALIFGIGLDYGAPWPLVAVGLGLNRFGMAPINILAVTYIQDAYNQVVGDAVVGVMVVRNVIGTAFVFAQDPWIAAMGIRNMLVMMVVIHFAVMLGVAVFVKWGRDFRVRSVRRYKYYASRQYTSREDL